MDVTVCFAAGTVCRHCGSCYHCFGARGHSCFCCLYFGPLKDFQAIHVRP